MGSSRLSCTILFTSPFYCHALFDRPAESKDGGLQCELYAGRFLSPWQVIKKALWDHVRDSNVEASVQRPALAHLSAALEKTVDEKSCAFESMCDCPAGLICLKLYLLELKSKQDDCTNATLQHVLDNLLYNTFRLQWSSVLLSEWPLFSLFYRVVNLQKLFYASSLGTSDLIKTAELRAVSEIAAQSDAVASAQAGALSLIAANPGVAYGSIFLCPEAKPFWEFLHKASERYLSEVAIGGPSPSQASAAYFLEKLPYQYVGRVAALGYFLESLLEKNPLPSSYRFGCWDIGAAPGETSLDASAEVWAICHRHGGQVRAFEPSLIGYERLASAIGTMGCTPERIAFSNFTGSSRFNRGGKSTGSLGDRGCGMWMKFAECDDDSNWETVHVVSVDALLGDATLDILKIDAEGQEWNIVLGAQAALSEGRIGLVILEYGEKWSHEMAMATKHYDGAYHYASAADVPPPTLFSVVQWFDARGYLAYMIGTRTVLPISGEMWHDIYEVCRSPHRPHYHGVGLSCWFDVAFVFKDHLFAAKMETNVLWDLLV